MFTNLELQERYLPIIRGAGTPFPCVPRHFNHYQPATTSDILKVKVISPASNRPDEQSNQRPTVKPEQLPQLAGNGHQNVSIDGVERSCFRC